ncbi:MAG: ABC transporter ATP-binding protein/permease [Eubacterium sp.]|nr:ABC transporter ATP-binding protein/permease [Eubacterium sp.]
MKTKRPIARIAHAHLYVLKIVWQIDKKRVLLQFLERFCTVYEYLIYGAIFTQVILSLVEKNLEFQTMFALLWAGFLPRAVIHIYLQYYTNMASPVSDVRFLEGMTRLLYEKACLADLTCFEDSEFYNQYMMAVREAKARVPKMLYDISDMIVSFLAALTGFYMIWRMNRYALLFIILPILGNFVFNGILSGRLFRLERETIIFKRIADYVNRTIHLADYAKEIRLSNVFSLLGRKYDESVKAEQKAVRRYAPVNLLLFFCFQYFTFTLLFNGSFLYAGYHTLVTGSMVFAELAVFQNFMCTNTWDFLYSAEAAVENIKNSFFIEQIEGFLNYEPKIPEDADGMIPERTIRTITFSHVSFGYQEGRAVLKDVCLELHAGQHAALVGFNGSGKTTLMKLLLRLYDPDEGAILVNGTDIREYNLRAYRSLFTAAFQDGKIFADTVEENILMGAHQTPEQDAQTVWKALKLAGMEEEVRSWDRQEKTVLTKEFSREGMVLSGGQSQKIIAARAFAKDCPVAVFDEPSSALDPIAEYSLFANILRFSGERMLFFISHRLSSVRNADVVFFLENGRITERGSHKELMEKNGKYASLYRTQAKNYLA